MSDWPRMGQIWDFSDQFQYILARRANQRNNDAPIKTYKHIEILVFLYRRAYSYENPETF